MSVGGPSALGTLLVQRLDAALGTTLSQQANLVTGARPDAVTQAASPERADALRTETQRHPREVVERATAQTEQQGRGAVDKARLDARTGALLLSSSLTNTATTPSAPTTLGFAARTILALLASFPEQAAAVQGRQPLLPAKPDPSGAARPHSTGQPATEGTQTPPARTAGAGGGGSPAGTAATAGTPAGGSTGAAGSGSAGSAAPGAASASGAGSASNPIAAVAGTTLHAAAPPQLAQTLAQVLQTSGMFYESHLGNLAFGKQSLAQLMLEPQAQAGRPAAGNTQAPAPSTAAAGEPASARAAENTTPASATVRAADAPGSQPAAGATQASAQHASALLTSGMDPQTHMLVRQQLEVLANQTFAWRGEAWPDAPMEWEVSRRAGQDDGESPQTEHWATRINIHLPALGQVQAQLTLAGQQLVMHLVAPDSAGLLSRHTETLRGRYSAQGLHLSQLSIADEHKTAPPAPIAGFDPAAAELNAAANGTATMNDNSEKPTATATAGNNGGQA